jgi:hypothetical protein
MKDCFRKPALSTEFNGNRNPVNSCPTGYFEEDNDIADQTQRRSPKPVSCKNE